MVEKVRSELTSPSKQTVSHSYWGLDTSYQVKMGKKRYNSRQSTSVETGKYTKDVKLPAINRNRNVSLTEGKVKMRKKPGKQSKEKGEGEEIRVTNERIIELFEIQVKEKCAGRKSSTEPVKSLDTALEMLNEKEKKKEANRIGAELEDIKDRMNDVFILFFSFFILFIRYLLLPSTVTCYVFSFSITISTSHSILTARK